MKRNNLEKWEESGKRIKKSDQTNAKNKLKNLLIRGILYLEKCGLEDGSYEKTCYEILEDANEALDSNNYPRIKDAEKNLKCLFN